MGFEELGKKLVRLGQDTKSGVQKMGESYQINAKIGEEKKKLEQLYRAVGEAVYQENREKGLKGLEEEFEAIGTALENIAAYTHQLNKVKGVLYCTECGREAAKGERFCSGCGAKLPEEDDDISEKMKQDAREAVGEAGEIMGDVVDKARGFMGSVADKADAFVKGVSSKINNRGADEAVFDLEEDEVEVRDAKAAEGEEVNPEAVAAEAEPETVAAEAEPETVTAEAEPETTADEAEVEPETAADGAEAEPETVKAGAEAELETVKAEAEAEPETVKAGAEAKPETVAAEMEAAAEAEAKPETVAAEEEAVPWPGVEMDKKAEQEE